MESSVKGPEGLNHNHCRIQESCFWVRIKGDETVSKRDHAYCNAIHNSQSNGITLSVHQEMIRLNNTVHHHRGSETWRQAGPAAGASSWAHILNCMYALKQRGQLEKARVFKLSKPISSDIFPLTRPYLPKQCQPLGTTCSNPWLSRGYFHSSHYRRICETGNGSDAQNRMGLTWAQGCVCGGGEIGLESCQGKDVTFQLDMKSTFLPIVWYDGHALQRFIGKLRELLSSRAPHWNNEAIRSGIVRLETTKGSF